MWLIAPVANENTPNNPGDRKAAAGFLTTHLPILLLILLGVCHRHGPAVNHWVVGSIAKLVSDVGADFHDSGFR